MSVLNLDNANPTSGINDADTDGIGFADLLDIINPLHHLPILGSLYRKLTGDTIDPAMKLAGGALYGGPIGIALSAVELAFTSNGETETIEYGGVNAASVAGNYPFQQAELSLTSDDNKRLSNEPIKQTSTSSLSDTDSGHSQSVSAQQQRQPVIYRYSDGIPNLAYSNQPLESALISQTNETIEPVITPYWQSDTLNQTYLNSEIKDKEIKPLIDIYVGEKQHPG